MKWASRRIGERTATTPSMPLPARTHCLALFTSLWACTSPSTDTVVEVVIASPGSGTVTSSPVGLLCGSTCSASFASENAVSLHAEASDGYEFLRWSLEECGTSPQCVVTAGFEGQIGAEFVPETRTLRLDPDMMDARHGVVVSEPDGLYCPPACEVRLDRGTEVKLRVETTDHGWFRGWNPLSSGEEDHCMFGGYCEFALNEDVELAPRFSQSPGGSVDSIGKALVATKNLEIHAVQAIDSGSIVAGAFQGQLWYRQQLLATNAELGAYRPTDAFVAAFDDAGQLSWIKLLQGPGRDRISSLAVSGNRIAIVGLFEQTLQLGELDLVATEDDLFVAELDLDAEGELVWARRFEAGAIGGYALTTPPRIAINRLGEFIVTAIARGDMGFDEAAPSTIHVVLFAVDESGTNLWTHHVPFKSSIGGLALAPDDSIYLAWSSDTQDIYDQLSIAKFSPLGLLEWENRDLFGWASDLVVDFDGGIGVAGGAEEPFLSIVDEPQGTESRTASFIARLEPQGTLHWIRRIYSETEPILHAYVGVTPRLLATASGDLVVSVAPHREFDSGNGIGTSSSLFVSRYSPSGSQKWVHDFGVMPPSWEWSSELRYPMHEDSFGNVVIASSTGSTFQIGNHGVFLENEEKEGMYFLRLRP